MKGVANSIITYIGLHRGTVTDEVLTQNIDKIWPGWNREVSPADIDRKLYRTWGHHMKKDYNWPTHNDTIYVQTTQCNLDEPLYTRNNNGSFVPIHSIFMFINEFYKKRKVDSKSDKCEEETLFTFTVVKDDDREDSEYNSEEV